MNLFNQRLITKVVLLISGIALVACSEKLEVKKAPASEKELGYVVQGPSLQSVKDNKVKYRIVNEKHNLYEVYETESVVKNKFPEAKIEKNSFRQRDYQDNHEEILERDISRVKKFLESCDKEKMLSIGIQNTDIGVERDKLSSNLILELGNKLNLKAIQLDGDLTGETEFLWSLKRTGNALYDQYIFEGQGLSVGLKGLGLNILNVMAKDKNNICGIAEVEIIVSSNEPLLAEAPEVKAGLDETLLDQINEAKAYDRPEGINKVKIAVIDSGVNYNHFELYDSINRNDGEIPGNGLDDDGNGFADDYVGYDFYGADPYPMDNGGHGSHVSGLIGGLSTGVTRNASIIPVKVGSVVGYDAASLAGAIFYAVDSEARVINLSLGSALVPSQAEISAYEYTIQNDVVLVVASGNGDPNFGIGYSLDQSRLYPASLNMPNKIVVAASSAASKPLTRYSNYGSVVDIVAPGGDFNAPLYSLATANDVDVFYAPMSGTSMASPIVAGVIVELISRVDKLKPDMIKKIIQTSGDLDEELENLIPSKKHLNADEAYKLLGTLVKNGRL